jgi:hypothetical protein
MRRDLEPLCSTLIKQSPSWNKSSIPGMNSRVKWFGEVADFGTQMSLSLGRPLCLSENAGAILRKVGGVVEVLL